MANDFDILIGVDMTTAKTDITTALDNISTTYKLKIDAVIGNESDVINGIKNIQKLLDNLSKMGIDLGLDKEIKDADKVAKNLGKDLDKSMKDAKNGASAFTDEIKSGNDELRKQIKLMKDANGNWDNDNKVTKTTTGNKYKKVTATTVGDSQEPVKLETTINNEKKISDEKKLQKMLSEQAMKLQSNLDDIQRKGLAKKQSMTKYQGLINDLNKKEITDLDKLEKKLEAIAKQQSVINQQVKNREFLNKKNNEVEKLNKNIDKNADEKLFPRETKALRNSVNKVGDAENFEDMRKAIDKAEKSYEKLISKQELYIAKAKAVDSLNAKIGKTDANVLTDERENVKKSVGEVSNAKTQEELASAIGKVENAYKSLLSKQEEYISRVKAENEAVKSKLATAKKEADELNKIWHDKSNNTQKELDKEAKYKEDHDKARIQEEINRNKKESEVLEEQAKNVKKLKEQQRKDEEKLANKMGDANSKSQVDSSKKEEESVLALHKAINKEIERTGLNQIEINNSAEKWEQQMREIKNIGLIDDSDFNKAKSLINGLSSESTSLKKELKDVEKELKNVKTLAESRVAKDKAMNATKRANNTSANEISERNLVPQSMIDNYKSLSNMLDFSSDAEDVKIVKKELDKLLALEKEIKQAGQEQHKIEEAIKNAKMNTLKAVDKYSSLVEKVQYSTEENIQDEARRNLLQEESFKVLRNIHSYKDRVTDLTYEESQELQGQILNLQRLYQSQKSIESSVERELRMREALRREVASVTYRAGRGLDNSPREREGVSRRASEIQGSLDGLNNLSGREFDGAVANMRNQIHDLNMYSQDARNRVRDNANSMVGQLGNAMQKVPVWMSAMGLFYGALNQVKLGFQNILDYDKAMVNLQKVTEASTKQLDAFKDTAHQVGMQLGVTATEVIKATTEFQKIGYTLQESALLGKNTILYANVGDMGIDQAQENIVSAVKGFNIEVDKSGNNVRHLVDVFNEVGNNYAITSAGIGEALRRSSAVLSEAGNSIEQSVALVTSANTTIQNPERVGTALKTVSMRLRGVSEEGKHVAKLVPDIEKVMIDLNNKLGLSGDSELTLMKDENTFLSTFEIFDKIAKQWENLEDIERANLVELIGGKEQGAIVSAMINNWSDATNSYATALNSAGSAQREFENVMNSFDYKIGRLKSALEAFWLTLIDSEAVKGFIDGLTSIITVITKLMDIPAIGGNTIIMQLLGLVAMFSSRSLRGAVMGIGTFSTALTTLGATLGGFIKTIAKSIPGFFIFSLAIWGVTKAVEALYKLFSRDTVARDKRINTLRDEITEMEALKSAYESFNTEFATENQSGINRLETLEIKGSTRTTSEEVEYQKMIENIKEGMPNAIAYYDEFGNAVARSASEIRTLNQELEKNLAIKAGQLVDEEIKDADFGDLEKEVHKKQVFVDNMNQANAEVEIYTQTKKWIEEELSELEQGSPEYFEKIEEIKNRARDLMASNEGMDSNQFDTMSYYLFDENLMNGNVEQGLSFLDGLKATVDDRIKSIAVGINDSDALIAQNIEQFAMLLNTKLQSAVQEKGFSMDSNEMLLAHKLSNYVLENLDKFDEDSHEILENIPDMFQNMIDELGEHELDIDNLLIMNPETGEATAKAIEKIIKSLPTETEEGRMLIKMLEDLRLEHLKTADSMNSKSIRPISFENDVVPLMDEFEGSILGLDSAYRTLADGQELSVSQMFKLISEYPNLTKHLQVHNGQIKISGTAIKELAKIKEEEFKKDLQIKKAEAENAKIKAKASIMAIMSEAKAEQLLNDIRTKGVQSALKQSELKMKALESESMLQLAMNPTSISNGVNVALKTALAKREHLSLVKNANIIADTENTMRAIEALLNADYSGNLGNISNIAKDKKEKKEKEKKELQDAYYVVDKYQQKIQELDSAIQKQQTARERYSSSAFQYRNTLNAEIKLTKEKRKAIDDEIKSLEKQVRTKNLQKTGLISVKSGEDTDTARKKQAELQQEIDKTKDKIMDLKGESDSLWNSLMSLSMAYVQSNLDNYEIQRNALEDDIAYTEYAMGLYDSASKNFRFYANTKKTYLQEQLKIHEQELAYLEAEKRANKDLSDAEMKNLESLIIAKRGVVYQMSQSVIDMKNQIANSALEEELYRMTTEAEKYAKKINELNNKIKYSVDEGEYAKEIDYMKQIISYKKGEIADIKFNIEKLKKLKAENVGNLEISKKITDEIGNWEDKLIDAENSVLDVQKQIENTYKELADRMVEIYKEQLELMRKADEDYYKRKMDAERKAHDSRMAQIDKEMNAIQKAYDIQNKKLDREEATRDYSNNLTELQKEAQELRKQIDILSLDDSYEAKAKKAELVKQLAEKELELAEIQHDREYELRRQGLEDSLETDLEKLESKRDALQAEYDAWVENEEKKQEEKMKYWEEEMQNERKFAEIRLQIMQGNFDGMTAMLQSWSSDVSSQMGELGQIITNNFTDKIFDAIKALTDLKNMKIGSFNGTVNGIGSSNLNGDPVYGGIESGGTNNQSNYDNVNKDTGGVSAGGQPANTSPQAVEVIKAGNLMSLPTGGVVKKQLKVGERYKYYNKEQNGMWNLGNAWFPKANLKIVSSTSGGTNTTPKASTGSPSSTIPKPTTTPKPVATPTPKPATPTAPAVKKYTGQYADIINQASAKYNVDPFLIASIIKQESGFNANAVSGAGATGLMQLMPATAKGLGVSNSKDPYQNIMGGTKYIAQQLEKFSGNIQKALYAYNAGAGNVSKILSSSAGYWKEPKNYYSKVMGNYASYTGGSYGSTPSTGSTGSSGGSSGSTSSRMKTTSSLNLRSDSSYSGSVVAVMPKGATVQFLGMENGWAKVSFNGKTGYAGKDYLQSFDTGGYTGSFGKEGRLGILHEKELILNQEQTKDILSTAKIVEKMKTLIPNLMSYISSPVQTSNSNTTQTENNQGNVYNVDVKIENLNGNKKDATRVGEQIVNEMKKNKGGRF